MRADAVNEQWPLVLQPTDGFEEVRPTKSFGIASCPCEIKAAEIANKSFSAINKENTSDIYYRFLQSKKAQSCTMIQIAIFGFFSLVALAAYIFCMSYKSQDNTKGDLIPEIICILSSLLSGFHIPPNIANTLRYRMIKNTCDTWLSEHADQTQFARIKDLKFNDAGLSQLCQEIAASGNLPEPTSERLKTIMRNSITV